LKGEEKGKRTSTRRREELCDTQGIE